MKKRQPTEFGKEVQAQLAKLGKTQKQFAQEIGISTTYLSLILHGNSRGKKIKSKIAKQLNIDLIELEKWVYSIPILPENTEEGLSTSQAAASLLAIFKPKV